MKKLNYFETREECKKFLDQFNFKYFIPYLEDFIDYNRYHVQLNDDMTNVIYCNMESIYDGLIHNQYVFYDCNRVYDFQLAEDGEAFRKELKDLERVVNE